MRGHSPAATGSATCTSLHGETCAGLETKQALLYRSLIHPCGRGEGRKTSSHFTLLFGVLQPPSRSRANHAHFYRLVVTAHVVTLTSNSTDFEPPLP